MAPDVLPSPHQSPPLPLPSPAAHPNAAAPPLPSRPNDKPTPHSSPSPPPAAIVAVSSHAARYNPPRRSTPVAAPALAAAGGRGGDWFSWSGRNSQPPQQQRQPPPPPPPPPADRVVSDIVSRDRRAAALLRAELAARAAGACLCLAALSVLAADRRKGWALDSYSNYTQFRYSETVNVIGFLYSIFQFYALAEYMRKKKHVIPRPKGNYFNFAMDQVLAYLLISSSSSATARVGDWIDNWGSDPFPNMANGSIAISFLAFLVFAASSLISAYNLFRRHL